MSTKSRVANKTLHLLVAVLILLTSLPMSTSVAVASDDAGDVVQAEAPVQKKRLEPGIRLYAVCDPAVAKPGEEVTCSVTVVNDGEEDVDGLALHASLAEGLAPGKGTGRTWQAEVPPLAVGQSAEVALGLRVSGRPSEAATFEIELRQGREVRATTTAVVGVERAEKAQRADELGGQFTGGDGRVKVDFRPGALRAPADVSARIKTQKIARQGLKVEALNRNHPLLQFDLEARGEDGEMVKQFGRPVNLSVDLRGLIDAEGLPAGHYVYLAYVADPELGLMREVDAKYDTETGLLTAQVDHFSEWEIGTVGGGWNPVLTPPVPDLFSGAVTYNYPIAVPEGRNGLQPNVALSYNSRQIDMLKDTEASASGPVALGWSLGGSDVEITRFNKIGPASGDVELYSDFSLSLNGAGYDLVPVGSANCGQYRVEGAPAVYVERRNASCGQGSPENRTTDYWIVRVEGMTYQLGYTATAEAYIEQEGNRLKCYGSYCSPDSDTFGATRWRVDTVTDAMGNRMEFIYREDEIETEISNPPFQHSFDIEAQNSLVTEIRYNNYGTNQWASKVVFVPDSDDPDEEGYMRIERVDVYHLGARVRQIEVETDQMSLDDHSERALVRIWERSGDEAQAQPPVEIAHVLLPNRNENSDRYRRVSEINLGYGGRIAFDYINDGRSDRYSYRVAETRVYDGMGNPPSRTTYAYGTRCYDQHGSYLVGGVLCRGKLADQHTNGPLVGHSWVTVTALDFSGAPINKVTHKYDISDTETNPPHWKRGKEWQTETYDADETLLQKTHNTWATWDANKTFVYISQVDTTDYTGALPINTKTTYGYEPAQQGGAQYGNLTHVREYGAGTEPYRTTVTTYNPNTTASVWILSKPQQVKTYAGDPGAGGTQIGLTKYWYDRESGGALRSWNATPTKGSLVKTEVTDVISGTSEPVVTEMWYDDQGNLTKTRDPLDGEIEITYDTVYNLYPVEAINAAENHRYVEYYGVNYSARTNTGEYVWVEDTVPAGATLYGTWTWVTGSPSPYSGAKAHQSTLTAGTHQHYFSGTSATMGVQADERLFVYVYLDPANPPREVMLQWFDGSWDHRAYWGENLINWGTDGTNSRRYMGPRPEVGKWVRLEVDAAQVGLAGRTVNGMAFTLYDGRATWDRAGKSGGGLPGQVGRVWDDNGGETATAYSYDALGRLARVVRPGDTLNLPTTAYWYDDTTGKTRVVREYYSDKWRDHAYNTVNNWETERDKNYLYQSTPFRLSAAQEAGTVALHRYLYVGGWDTWHHNTKYTTGSLGTDWEYQGILGYIWTSPGPGRVGLYQCGMLEYRTHDHLLVLENDPCPTEYTDDGRVLLGYVEPTNGAPIRVGVSQREVSGQAGTLDSFAYYDGWGREIQTLSEAENGQWTVSSTEYDALGRVMREYTPQFESGSGYTAPPKEQVVYEAEGPDLFHNIGSANGSVWLSPSAGQWANYLTYGPYKIPSRTGPGQIVRFRMAVDTAGGSNDVVATLDVHDVTAGQVVAQRDVRRKEFTGGLSNFVDFSLTFDTTGREGHYFEYRVYWSGAAQMAHDRTTVIWNAPDGLYTLTSYDALGRAIGVVNPDGTASGVFYGGLDTLAVDANGHVKLSHNDVWGRLAAVDEALAEWSDDFGDSAITGWVTAGAVQETSGVMRVTGDGTWSTSVRRPAYNLSDGQGVILDFKYDPGSVYGTILLDTGTWGQPSYRRWGLHMINTTLEVLNYEGSAWEKIPLLTLRTGVWYRVFLRIGGTGEFVAVVWERDNPGVHGEWRDIKGSGWDGLSWRFTQQVNNGVAELDNYQELTFNTTSYDYDTLDHLTRVEDAAGNVTTMTYDGLGHKVAMDDPDMGHWEYRYDAAGNLVKQRDARNQAVCFYYDELHRLEGKAYRENVTNIDDPFLCYTESYDVTYTYDESEHGYSIGRRTGMSDDNSWTAWTYDARGRVTKEDKHIDGTTYTTEYPAYDAMDRVVQMKYPGVDEEVVTYAYNNGGALESLSGIDTYVTSIDYNPMGQVTSMELGNALTTQYTYDPLNFRLKNLQVDDLLDLSYDYDAVGNVTQIADGHAPVFQDKFDTKNTANWTWNSYQTVPYNDGGNNVVRNAGTGSNYDASFYRTAYSLTDGEGIKLRFKVDRTDNQAHFTVVANDTIYRRFGVRAHEGELQVEYNDGTAGWLYPADLIANLQVNTWYVLQIVLNDDGQGFYVEAYQENNPSVCGSYSVQMPAGKQWRFQHWVYRGNAYIDDYEEFDAVQQFAYDALDRLTHAQAPGGPAPYNRTYIYNEIGNIVSRVNEGVTLNYTYPASGPTSVRPHAAITMGTNTYDYDANGNMTDRTITGDGDYDLTFNAENKVVQVKKNGSVVTTFTYDGDGNRVKKEENDVTTYYVGGYYEKQVVGAGGEVQVTITGAEASVNQSGYHISESYNGIETGSGDGWAYSANIPASGVYKFSAQAVNKIVVVSGIDRSDHNPNDYYLYYTTDANPTIGGNWTSLAGLNFLNSVAGGSISGNHVTCNGQDQVQLGFNPVTATGIKIVIYGSNASNENSVLTEFKVYASETVTKYYYAGSQRVAMRQNGVVTYLHGDHLGSTSLTTDANGDFVARVLYYPYGEERYEEGTLTTDYGFTGQRKDSYLDTYSMGAREYDFRLGRWLSADTIVPEPGNPQSLNRFAYVDNNPLKYIDPSGHYKCIVYAPGGECLEWADDDLEGLKDHRDDVPQSSDRVGPLPSSYVQYTYCAASGKCYSGVGVAISPNTILTHDHVRPNVVRIQREDPSSGAVLSIVNAGDFAYASPNDTGDAMSLFVFRNDLFGDVATLGDVDDLVGSNISAEEAIRRSIYAEQEGMYSTEVIEVSDGWIHVSPDFTIAGDSGAPLFVNGKVYGINNQGTGKCGAVTDPERIYQLATSYTDTLRKPEVAGPPPGSRIR